MFVLEVLGTLSLRGDTRPVPVAAQQKRPLGLLAILGIAGRQGRSRDRIEAYLWPESSGALARHSLDQTVYALRHALGSDVIVATGRELRLNQDVVQVDVWEFEDAIRAREWKAAVGRYKGALLDGVHFGDSRELEAWIDTERARLLGEYQAAVEALADIAVKAGDHSQSVSWYRRLANSDPLSTGATKKLMLALAGAGDRAGAVKHARLYQELVRQQLQMEPDAEIERLASALSQPEKIEIVRTAARRPPESFATPPGADTEIPVPKESGFLEATLRTLSPRNALPSKRWRMATVLTSSVLIVLLIGAVTIEKRQGRDRRPRLAEVAARSSATPLSAARGAYLHALDSWSDGSKEGLDSAVVYFGRATELDPGYAAAYAGLADAYVMLAYFGYRSSDAMFPRAKEAALRSMRLDSTLASAHPALAYELTWERDFVGADSEFRKAVAFDPTQVTAQAMAFDPAYATAHQWYGILLMILGQKPGAVTAIRRPVSEDPFSLHVPITEISFTKWFDDYPAIEGFTSYGPGTIAGQVLSRIDDGDFTHIVARYEVTDPNGRGTHSWKAVLQGKGTNKTGIYDLNGIVTWGWMTGAQVHANFQRIAPCEFGKRNICFQGTIQIQR